jgi:hypothetical protein
LDGTYTGVLDRFEEELAVVVVEVDEQTAVERVLDRGTLPSAGRHVDAVLELAFERGTLADVTYRPDETRARRRSAQRRFDRLSRRLGATRDGAENDGDG